MWMLHAVSDAPSAIARLSKRAREVAALRKVNTIPLTCRHFKTPTRWICPSTSYRHGDAIPRVRCVLFLTFFYWLYFIPQWYMCYAGWTRQSQMFSLQHPIISGGNYENPEMMFWAGLTSTSGGPRHGHRVVSTTRLAKIRSWVEQFSQNGSYHSFQKDR